MEENPVKSNVVEIRPGTSAQTDREREFVDCLLTKLREYREMGVEVDSMLMCFIGTKPEFTEEGEEPDPYWLSVFRFIDEARPAGMTLAYMVAYIQKYMLDGFSFVE